MPIATICLDNDFEWGFIDIQYQLIPKHRPNKILFMYFYFYTICSRQSEQHTFFLIGKHIVSNTHSKAHHLSEFGRTKSNRNYKIIVHLQK